MKDSVSYYDLGEQFTSIIGFSYTIFLKFLPKKVFLVTHTLIFLVKGY